jgi:putative endonuclease
MAKRLRKGWEVYIIQTKNGKLYTGITTNLDQRFKAHLEGSRGARFFRFSKPKAVLFREKHPNRSAATKREIAIKKLSRKEKLALIKMS